MFDLIILLAVAAFFVSRLRKILGNEIEDDFDPTKKNKERIIHLRDRPENRKENPAAPEDDAPILADIGNPDVTKGLTDIKAMEPGFNIREFLGGAKSAFEMILEAFNKGDKQTLEMLLGKEIYADFEAEIDARSGRHQREENTLMAISSADITRARLIGRQAEITVQFTTEQISVVRDKEGKVIEGDASKPNLVTDEWTFTRELKSNDPNWILIST